MARSSCQLGKATSLSTVTTRPFGLIKSFYPERTRGGSTNYYRSSVRTSPKKAEATLRPISAPTLVICGQRDH
jgi:hypothetical protein